MAGRRGRRPLRVCADFIGIAAKLIKAFLVTFFSKKVTDKSKFEQIKGACAPSFLDYLSIAAAGDEKKRDDKKPDILVVKNVAKAVVHK